MSSGQSSTVSSSPSSLFSSSCLRFHGRWPSSTVFSQSSVLNLVLVHSEYSRHCTFRSSFFSHAYRYLNDHLSIGATILSHHVDGFTLVSAFFLFSVGCLNIMLGLIFREHAKAKRSIRAWKANDAGTLPMHTGNLNSPSFRSSLFGGKSAGASKPNGFGFGVQGEKQAGLKGTFLSPSLELRGCV